MKNVLMGIALGALIAAPASAADLRRPAPVPMVAPVPVVTAHNWSSCYIGGHVGGLWVSKDWNGEFYRDLGSHDANGWLGGVQAGCDWQFGGGWVIGIQADYAWADADGSHNDLVWNFENRTRVKSLGSATARLGYGWDRFLLYVKGGAAWAHDEYEVFNGAFLIASASEERRLGWTVGVGGEYAFNNWISAFVEYNYYDFGGNDRDFIRPNGAIYDRINIEDTKSVVKGGLNFRFGNWNRPPVVARY